MKDSVRIGFIGYGNMAQAIAQGLIKTQSVRPEDIYCCAKNYKKLCGNAQRDGVNACQNPEQTVRNSDVVVVAVKPYLVREVCQPISQLLREKIVVSVAAGCPFESYEEFLVPGTHHISTIPNTPVRVGEGIFVCENRHSLTEEELEIFRRIFSPIAMIQLVEPKLLDIAGTISGCGPAFVSLFLEALGDAGVLHGLPRTLAYQLAGQMVAGTGKLMVQSQAHPGVMKDAVCSPGGTTIVGVAALERGGLRSAVIEAVNAVQNK